MTQYWTQKEAIAGEEIAIELFRKELIELAKKHSVHVLAVGTRSSQPITDQDSMICAGFVIPTVDWNRNPKELDAIISSYTHAGLIVQKMQADSSQKQAITDMIDAMKWLWKMIGEVTFTKEGEKMRAIFADNRDEFLFWFWNNEQEALFDLLKKWSKK